MSFVFSYDLYIFLERLVKIQYIFTSLSRKIYRSYEKTEAILLARKYLNFPLVKAIVSKIAYEIIKNTKNDHFLMAHHRKIVREIFFRVFGNIILVKSFFKTIRFINRTNSRPIWTRTGEKRYHWKKVEDDVTDPPLMSIALLRRVSSDGVGLRMGQ